MNLAYNFVNQLIVLCCSMDDMHREERLVYEKLNFEGRSFDQLDRKLGR